MLGKPGICPTSDVIDANRSYGVDGFKGIHGPDKYKGNLSLNQEKMIVGTHPSYLTMENLPNNMTFILVIGGK